MAWGVASGDIQALFAARGPEASVRQQRALDHLLGADAAFDPAADAVTQMAEGAQDTLRWKDLSSAKMHMRHGVPQKVVFAAPVLAMNGKEVTLSGYMFPLEASGGQEHFLLSAYPPSCPYCLPGDASQMIEISDSGPVAFTYDRITIRGMFEVLGGEDLQGGMFYRMRHIELVH